MFYLYITKSLESHFLIISKYFVLHHFVISYFTTNVKRNNDAILDIVKQTN